MGNDESNECPYGASDCPKTLSLHDDLDNVNATLMKLTRVVYLMAGIISLQIGFLII